MAIMKCLKFIHGSEADSHQKLNKLEPPFPHGVIDTKSCLMIEKPNTKHRVLSDRLKRAPEKKLFKQM
ncbi:hypothetical protein DFH28DRAFT_878425 [Melampsora americana]|nr:hypothetical protein DFH28DRAFT_878425 [Melampsora americana]